jgi:hypothetical protein
MPNCALAIIPHQALSSSVHLLRLPIKQHGQHAANDNRRTEGYRAEKHDICGRAVPAMLNTTKHVSIIIGRDGAHDVRQQYADNNKNN